MDVTVLARLQFALTAGFHFLFVTLTLGLAPLIAVMQTWWVVTGRAVYREMTRFWGQLYLVNYGVGIVTGLVMEIQFGLDWHGLSALAGNVFGAPLAIEALAAFFLESTFLGMWIFGWASLPKYAHLALIWLVTATAFASAFWILVTNGYLQHPVGGVMVGGTVQLTDLGALVTNPEAVGALAHVLGATLLTGGLFVAGVSAWHLRRRTDDVFLRSFRIGVVVTLPGAFVAIHQGFAQFTYLKADQPAKMAAAFGGSVPGADAPPSWLDVPAQIMLDGGFALGVLSTVAAVLLLAGRGRLTLVRWLLRPLCAVVPVPFVLVLCGWVVREEGRQPWVVYGLLRTANAVSAVTVPEVAASLAVFVGIVGILAALDYRLIAHLARLGPPGVGLPDAPVAVPDTDDTDLARL